MKAFAKKLNSLQDSLKTRLNIVLLKIGFALDFEAAKKVARIARKRGDTSLYEAVITSIDPSFNFSFVSESRFSGKGGSCGALGSYRTVYIPQNEAWFFEKIYNPNSIDYKKMKWFYKAYSESSYLNFAIPELFFETGTKIKACYFEMIPPKPSPNTSQIIQIVNNIHQIQITQTNPELALWNEWIFNDALRCYRDWARENAKRLSTDRVLELITDFENRVPCVVSHGDLHQKNIFEGPVVIDFDRCGIFPEPYDYAYTFAKSIKITDIRTYESIIKEAGLDKKSHEFLQCLDLFFLLLTLRERPNKSAEQFLETLHHRVKSSVRARPA